jgi:hypothetical protein
MVFSTIFQTSESRVSETEPSMKWERKIHTNHIKNMAVTSN